MARRLAVLVDYEEEGWTSMDLCAEMLIRHLDGQGRVRPLRVCPKFRQRALRLPAHRSRGVLLNVDRLLNRFWDYPRAARDLEDNFDFFHVCDHSYSQLVHTLPPGRTGVYCHDLDAFRCLLDPRAEPRPAWFRALMRRVLDGLGKAAVVFCSTEIFKRRIEISGIIDPARVVLAPYGIADEFRSDPGDTDLSLPVPFDRETPYLLHVGSTIPRKRIDVLLDVFAVVRAQIPEARLVKVGGAWTDEQRKQIGRLGIVDALTHLKGLSRETLASLYRGAAVVLIPSEAEGFGLPLVEALACGASVVASDLEVFREVGGQAGLYAPIGDPDAWAAIVCDLIENRLAPISREVRLSRVSLYTWESHAKIIAETYLGLS